MTISTRDQLINALANNSSRLVIDKSSLASTVAGQFFSLWTTTGIPGAGAAPAAAATGRHGIRARAVPAGSRSLSEIVGGTAISRA